MAFSSKMHTIAGLFFTGLLILGFSACQQDDFREAQIPDHLLWPRPEIVPVPAAVNGVPEPVISLNGTWKFSANPPENFWQDEVDFSGWHDIRVPAQASFHIGDLTIRRDTNRPSYVYKRQIDIPADYAGKQIRLRFQGVTGTAKLWVNGVKAAEHHGGFTIWNPDITDLVTPGEQAVVTVSVHEPESGQSTNTYSGGIIRGVDMMALPLTHITRLHIDTDLDSRYRNAVMNIWAGMSFADESDEAEIRLTLTDPDGREVVLTPSRLELSQEEEERIVPIPVDNPLKWTAEHPYLYTIRADLYLNGAPVQSVERRVGFRKIEIDGRRLLVNGSEVKLRGSAQFDSHPLNGISLSREEVIRDLTLYKEANHNHVRPANYLPNEDFLAAADSIGMYISGEMPVTFAAVAARNEFLLPIFMSQTAETVEQGRNHPSILYWTLANETTYGFNIAKMAEYVFAEEPDRPVVFSWPQTIPHDHPLPYNIYSYHYPSYDDDVGRPGTAVFNSPGTGREIPPMPVLADEFAHPASYNNDEMRRDPNVRNFWGETIPIFWERMYTTHGSLGGAIFAFIDHPRTLTSGFPWGLLDKWRRPKPEYWHTRKAYSPVRLPEEPVARPAAGEPLTFQVRNWYDHTNLNMVSFEWSVGDESGRIEGPDVGPGDEGTIAIPGRSWQQGEKVHIRVFHNRDGMLVDEYLLPVDPPDPVLPEPAGPLPEITESGEIFLVEGEAFTISFSKESGLITSGQYKETPLIRSGPFLNIIGVELDNWSLSDMTVVTEDEEAVFHISGSYHAVPEQPRGSNEPVETDPVEIEVDFAVGIDGNGLMTTAYTIGEFPLEAPETKVVPWNQTNAGGYSEVGVSYLLTDSIDRLAWDRNGLWSIYPEDHIGRNSGVAPRTTTHRLEVGVEPDWSWSLDQTNFNLFGVDDTGNRVTNDFRSMKENIYEATALTPEGVGVRALSDGTEAVRLELAVSDTATGVRMHINNEWNYRHLGLGNYMKPPVLIENGYSNKVYVRLTSHEKSN